MKVFSSESGMKCAVHSSGSKVGYCALSIRVGTRNEGSYSSGIAHFMEHTLFKGTSRHNSDFINNRLERLGGELNAYTTREEIVLHATVLKDDIKKAAALLAEIAFEASFPEDEIEVEKGVVIDEIASYKDSPSDDIFDVFEEKIFAGTPLSRPILGTAESVQAITADELRRFRAEFFVPERMSFTMVAPLAEDKMEDIVRKITGKYGICSGAADTPGPEPLNTANIFDDTIDKKDHEVNCLMGCIAPSLYMGVKRYTAILLCNMLGGPASNSILGRILREKNGWVYNVECSYSQYSDTGVVMIAFGCDRENLEKCEKVVRRELHRLQEKPVSENVLKAAKRQLLGQNAIALESGESQCLSMGKSLLSFGEIHSNETVASRIAGISASDIQNLAVEMFADEKLCKLVYL